MGDGVGFLMLVLLYFMLFYILFLFFLFFYTLAGDFILPAESCGMGLTSRREGTSMDGSDGG